MGRRLISVTLRFSRLWTQQTVALPPIAMETAPPAMPYFFSWRGLIGCPAASNSSGSGGGALPARWRYPKESPDRACPSSRAGCSARHSASRRHREGLRRSRMQLHIGLVHQHLRELCLCLWRLDLGVCANGPAGTSTFISFLSAIWVSLLSYVAECLSAMPTACERDATINPVVTTEAHLTVLCVELRKPHHLEAVNLTNRVRLRPVPVQNGNDRDARSRNVRVRVDRVTEERVRRVGCEVHVPQGRDYVSTSRYMFLAAPSTTIQDASARYCEGSVNFTR